MTKRNKAGERPRILRWRGVLVGVTPLHRVVAGALLIVAGITLVFMQLGFVDVTIFGGSIAYAITLLPIVALGSLLLGTLWGTVVGAAVGVVLLWHAWRLPLDHFEVAFITVFTSIVMLCATGFLAGIGFAIALRNNPARVRRIIYITIVCIVLSWSYSAVFVGASLLEIARSVYEAGGADMAKALQDRLRSSGEIGSVSAQAWIDAIMMAVACIIGDAVARRLREGAGSFGLRSVFGGWLAVVAVLTFMIVSSANFTSTTIDEHRAEGETMKSEVHYLNVQVQAAIERSQLLDKVTELSGFDPNSMDDDFVEQFAHVFSEQNLLEGYTMEDDGTVVIAWDGNVLASNDGRSELGKSIEETFGSGAADALKASLDTGRVQRFIYNGTDLVEDQVEQAIVSEIGSHIAYLYAERVELDSDLNDGHEEVIFVMQPSSRVYANRTAIVGRAVISSFVLIMAVFLIVMRLLSLLVARRIDEENASLARITAGDLDVRAEADGTREFKSLSEGINTTVDALRGWIAEAESRMDAELATAKAIQESALPRIFPPFPSVMRFDIYASMNAAREVGGDFYDFFLIGNDCTDHTGKLGFVVADVSGKGVPAALFMMKAKTQIRDYVASGMELGEAVSEANRQLCEGNDEGMFVTAWVGVLDYGTGHIEYVNAGHNPPLLWKRAGGWQWMREKSGPMLGLFDRAYHAHSVECLPGETLLLYTDGVTEAFDADENLYGEERLLALAERGYCLHPRELLEALYDDVQTYAQDAQRSDDITMLALEVGVPPEVTATLIVPAQLDQLERVNSFLHTELDCRLCPQSVQTQIDIAVEELFVNVCNYAYEGTPAGKQGTGTVRIQRTYSADPPSLTVDIIDEGVPFDPLAKPDAVTPSNIEDVPIGGLGILMARKSVDEISYERAGGSNIVTIVKKW